MKIAVLDTSAIIRLFIPDGPLPDGLEDFVNAAWHAEASLLTPELALTEAAQVLRKKELAKFLKQPEVDDILSAIMALPLETIDHYDLLPDALEIARQKNLTVYDSLFLALAIKRKATLLTADEQLDHAYNG